MRVAIDRETGERVIIGPGVIDVRLHVRTEKQKKGNLLFGEDGREIWFEGTKNFSMPVQLVHTTTQYYHHFSSAITSLHGSM